MTEESKGEVCYITDGNGDKLTYGKASYQGETLYFPVEFSYMAEKLGRFKEFQMREDDVWLVTFTKSGTHWLYEIMYILMDGKLQETEHYKISSMVELTPDFKLLDEMASPRILNTHMRPKYLPLQEILKHKIVVCVRNPKSVAVSDFHHVSSFKSVEYEGTFSGFLPGHLQGYITFYGNWFQNVQEWWDVLAGRENVHFIYYEDLKQNPVPVIEELSRFLGVTRDRSFCEEVARLTSFENMVKETGKNEESKKAMAGLWKNGTNQIFRKGIIDDWKTHFSKAQNEEFDKLYDEKMSKYQDLKAKIRFQ